MDAIPLHYNSRGYAKEKVNFDQVKNVNLIYFEKLDYEKKRISEGKKFLKKEK